MPASAGFLEIKGGIGWYHMLSKSGPQAQKLVQRRLDTLCVLATGSLHAAENGSKPS